METWRLLAGVSVLMVVWAVLVTLLGQRPGPLEVVGAIAFAVVGMYLGEILSERIARRE